MRLRTIHTGALLLAGAILWLSGCGGGSSSLNQVVDSVVPASAAVIAGTTTVFTSTVTGSTNIDSSWTCSYSYLPANATSTTKPTTGTCTSGMSLNGGNVGVWTTNQTTTNSTLSYTAPSLSNFPNPIPTLTFTATADADKKKTGTATVIMDTGIRASLTPTTATVPVGITPAQIATFTASLANTPPTTLNWAVVQPPVGNTTISNTDLCNSFPAYFTNGPCGLASPLAKSCSPSCGSITGQAGSAVGIFTAPSSIPTDTSPLSSASNAASAAINVTVIVWANGDTVHFATATITLINASTNPVTFTGMSPTTVAAGGVLQDVWLDAKNILNTTSITFTDPTGALSNIDPTEIFTIPITKAYCTPNSSSTPAVTCDASILTRIRLNAAQLSIAGTGQITVHGIPGTPTVGSGCQGAATPGANTTDISCPINLVYASPAVVAAVPDSYPQNTAGQQFAADGGYFGASGHSLVELLFNGNLTTQQSGGLSTNSRRVLGPLDQSQTASPGLYPVSVTWQATTPPNAPPFPSATTNVAVQPTFSTAPTPASISLPAAGTVTNLAPSSMVVDSANGYAYITEQASNTLQVVNLAGLQNGQPLLPPMTIGSLNQPTSIAIDPGLILSPLGSSFDGQTLGAIVNRGNSTLTLVALPSGTELPGSPISLSGLITEPTGTTEPLPYAVGIDPQTHYAVVAFSNATIGFVVDVNPISHSQTCFGTSASTTPPCPIASVSLNTGPTPQVVVQPNAPLAYVTPGGSGVTSVVNLLLTNTSVPIPSGGAVCANSIATITTSVPNGLNQSAPGAVLVQGVSPTTPLNFNGTFNVISATTYTFTYALSCTGSTTAGGGSFTFGNPYYTFSTTPTAVGGAINPITRTFAFADPGASTAAPQVAFIRELDQSVSSLFLTVGSCFNGCSPSPSGAPEIGVRYVAWDPYTNVLIAYNPNENYNNISLINPGGPTATGSQSPYRIIAAIPTGQTGTGSYTPSGASAPVNVYGPLGYDPKTHLVLVANAGSNILTYMNLDPGSTFKKVHIRDIQVTFGAVPSAQPPLGSPIPTTPSVCAPQGYSGPYLPHGVLIGCTDTNGNAATLRIFGEGFSTGTPVVRLDGLSDGVTTTPVSDTEVDAAIAPSRLTVPHDFALDVLVTSGSSAVNSNTNELHAVQITPLPTCSGSANGAQPEGVAYDFFRNVAVVTNFGCNSVSIINVDSTGAHSYGMPYGSVLSTISVGTNPMGVSVIPRLGYAVVTNNGENSVSIIDISDPTNPKQLSFTSATCSGSSSSTTNICVGISPAGVAIDQDRALAIVANSGGNSISAVDLTPLLQTTAADCPNSTCVPAMQLVATSGPPKAVAIDPDREIAVVTNTQNTGSSSVTGGLDIISLSTTPPTRSAAASISSLTASATGIVYDPAPSTPLFYVTSTQQNAIYAFNPITGTASLIRVGVNPYSVAYNYQTGTLLSINSTSNTISVVDAVNAPVFATRETLGISSQSQFAATVDNFTNTAIIADQNNDRVVILALPK